MYRSERMQNFETWMDKTENLFSQLNTLWDGLTVITGDFNVGLLRPECPQVKRYTDMLESLNLHQHVERPTRITSKSKTMIDHIISNKPNCITYCNVLPCPTISDHDEPFVCINIRTTRFQPRFKFIRHEKKFDKEAFIRDFSALPFNLVYSTDDPDGKLEIFSSLFKSCLDEHAPVRRTKITRPPAPWLNMKDIRNLQNERNELRHLAHQTNSESVWNRFREVRNALKTKIKKIKRSFYQKALFSKRPKEIWQIIHRILHPNPQPVKADLDNLNNHFSSTAQRLLGSTPLTEDELGEMINSLPAHEHLNLFNLRQITHTEVLKELTTMRNDSSTGSDQIPAKYLKLVAEYIASPLTHIINSFISCQRFPEAWKQARVSPIPKITNPTEADHFRPISILPVLSKMYVRLVLYQLLTYINQLNVLNTNISGYRKGHSTTTVLLRIRDDIITAMKKGEVTLIAFADFSKAFDTVDHSIVLRKLYSIGFSNSSLNWILSYLTGRSQFVQINDKHSDSIKIKFGVPQGSILGPILFNLYVNDLQNNHECSCFQYADDTTLYDHCLPKDLINCSNRMEATMSQLESWASESNLLQQFRVIRDHLNSKCLTSITVFDIKVRSSIQ